eukprot:TRINITY_DN109212_c0_g1_i1.p1 TRINITY_DN109212_c0_g1~~TRINITY_DN109212_c0_g1_i1.p1  ORF type:complete len:246 (-),score=41.96 TRINITY_DN109212_c0_g1_i1:227-964(-)
MAVFFDMPPAYGVGEQDPWSSDIPWDYSWAKAQYPNWGMKMHEGYSAYSLQGPVSFLQDEPQEILVVNSTTSGAYTLLCEDATSADVVGLDAEWVPDFSYGSDNPISVLQFAFPNSRRCYVLQLGPMDQKLPPQVQMMMVNPEVLKVGFAVEQKDAEKFSRTGIAVTKGSVVDVQPRCAASMGLSWATSQSLSLRRAAQELLGCTLLKDKRCACSDWSRGQLTKEQIRYAALDAWVALRLYYLTQ